MKLYWAETPDHDEDWFIVASNARSARRFHEDEEGYDHGSASVTLVYSLPDKWQHHPTAWPKKGLLEDCGGVRINYTPKGGAKEAAIRDQLGVVTEAWSIGGIAYVPGDIVANLSPLDSQSN